MAYESATYRFASTFTSRQKSFGRSDGRLGGGSLGGAGSWGGSEVGGPGGARTMGSRPFMATSGRWPASGT